MPVKRYIVDPDITHLANRADTYTLCGIPLHIPTVRVEHDPDGSATCLSCVAQDAIAWEPGFTPLIQH